MDMTEIDVNILLTPSILKLLRLRRLRLTLGDRGRVLRLRLEEEEAEEKEKWKKWMGKRTLARVAPPRPAWATRLGAGQRVALRHRLAGVLGGSARRRDGRDNERGRGGRGGGGGGGARGRGG
eukprot:9241660-Pyramimonas_sp.AAC.1